MEPILTFLLICCSSFIGPSMGVYEGELNYCPPTPNCVSSQSWNWNPIHSIKPYTYTKRQKKLPIRFQNSHIFGVWEYPIFYKTGNYFWRRVYKNISKEEAFEKLKNLLDNKENVHIQSDREKFSLKLFILRKYFDFLIKQNFYSMKKLQRSKFVLLPFLEYLIFSITESDQSIYEKNQTGIDKFSFYLLIYQKFQCFQFKFKFNFGSD